MVSHCRHKTRYGFSCLVLMFALGMASSILAQSTEEALTLGERPTVNGEPTVVEMKVFVFDIDEIDDVKQRFSVDLFITVRWKDHRLALPESERKGQTRFLTLEQVWTPRALVLNDRGLTPQLRQGVTVDDFGNAKYQNRMAGELAANLEFREFPFDVQQLPIEIVSYQYTADEMQFSAESSIQSADNDFSIEGWQLKVLESNTGVFMVPNEGIDVPYLNFTIEAERDSDYYILTMLVPMSLIIFMAWTVFWLQPNIVPPRIAISTASIFSLIALGVSIRLGLPKVSYLTKADVFVLGCTLMVFLALAVAVLGSRWASSDRMELALKANAISRWVYLIVFAVLSYLAFSV